MLFHHVNPSQFPDPPDGESRLLVDTDGNLNVIGADRRAQNIGALVSGGGKVRAQSLPQLHTIAIGNSITHQSRYGTVKWEQASDIHLANALAGSPMRFRRIAISGGTEGNWNAASGTLVSDVWSVAGYSGARVSQLNSSMEVNWLAPIHTAGYIPDLVILHSMLENDIAQDETVASMQSGIKLAIQMVRRWPNVRIILCTPRPSFSYSTPTRVANYQAIRDWCLSLDDGASIFVARLDGYENTATPGMPLAGYTDATVHPNTRGSMVNARVLAATLQRIAVVFTAPFRSISQNYGLSGSVSAVRPGITGTKPTGGIFSDSTTVGIASAAENPGWLMTYTPTVGANVAPSAAGAGVLSISGGPSTQLSICAEVEIVSGAENLREVRLHAVMTDGTGNIDKFLFYPSSAEADIDWQDGDVLTLVAPPIVARSGVFSAGSVFITGIAKNGGSGSNAISATPYTLRVKSMGFQVVVP